MQINEQERLNKNLLKNAVEFHGHLCFGLLVGYRASVLALKLLKADKSKDDELFCISENDSCAVDAVQYIAGCTLGKGNLKIKKYGKHAYTFAKRSSENKKKTSAYRITINYNAFAGLNKKDRMKKIKENNDKELFNVKKIKLKLPEKAKVYPSVQCAKCKEQVMLKKTFKVKGKLYCTACYKPTVR